MRSVLKTRAVSAMVQFTGGAEEKAKPGIEATTTSNETFFPVVVVASLVRSLMTGANSRKEPGQPWTRSRGIASLAFDFSWMKWICSPSITAV